MRLTVMRYPILLAISMLACVPASAQTPSSLNLPARASQGAMLVGQGRAGDVVDVGGRRLRVDADGRFVFGIGRDETGPVSVTIRQADGRVLTHRIAITPRDWPIQRINGVPPATVNPPPKIAARIARENTMIAAARKVDSANAGFAQDFIWPVQGRISGRFGNQRIYNGTPKSPHSGMDIAATTGTPVRAPASGTVTLAQKDFYLTGGTVMIDHGHGIGSNFLHLSRLDVSVGEVVAQGDVIGAVGSTGRSIGPHLHWGMTWFDTRIDPLLVLPAN